MPPTFLIGGWGWVGGSGMFIFHLNYVCITLTINYIIPINYLVENFNKLTQMAVSK